MAHIANKIDAKDKKLQEIFQGNRYKIDVFQREYRWQREQIEALISDLSSSFLNNYEEGNTIEDSSLYDCYYMGPIVLCEDNNALSIVDGQQRLTSFTLLLIYLSHLQNSLNISNELTQDFENYIYVKKAGKKTLVLNIESRNTLIEELINNKNIGYSSPEGLLSPQLNNDYEDLIIEESLKNILGRYEDIIKFFPPELKEKQILPIFIEWLLDKVVLVEIKAYNLENAYTIFETMNDRGLSLNPTEILKAFLLSNIKNDERAEEANTLWKKLINDLKTEIGRDADLDFFRAWLRGKYAITKRSKTKGSENEDFEKIGVQFHSWIKANSKKINLKKPDDFYYFILSDLEFYLNLYIFLFDNRNYPSEDLYNLYITNFFSIADSLVYPLFLAPIKKTDSKKEELKKLIIVNNFIDRYANIRMILGKPITQSSIRAYFYELIKDIRNASIEELDQVLSLEIGKQIEDYSFPSLNKMDNGGYYHYFLARILNTFEEEDDFIELLRSRKQSSYVLIQIYYFEDFEEEDPMNLNYIQSIGNFCLIRRYHLDEFSRKNKKTKINFLHKNKYLPEFDYANEKDKDIKEIISYRDNALMSIARNIWFEQKI